MSCRPRERTCARTNSRSSPSATQPSFARRSRRSSAGPVLTYDAEGRPSFVAAAALVVIAYAAHAADEVIRRVHSVSRLSAHQELPVTDSPRVSTRRVYTGRVLNLDIDTVRFPNGTIGELEMIRHPGASAVVPFLSDPAGDDPQVAADPAVSLCGRAVPVRGSCGPSRCERSARALCSA